MITKKDKATLEEMLNRIGTADLLALLGNLLKDKASQQYAAGDASAVITDRVADDLHKASEY